MAVDKLVFLPTPGVGHLISMVEMAKRLLRRRGLEGGDARRRLSATMLVPGPILVPAVASYIETVAGGGFDIEFEELPLIDQPTDTDGFEEEVSRTMESSTPHVRSAVARLLQSSSVARIAALIVDFFATPAIDVAQELGVPCFIYFTSGAATLALMLHLPELYEKITVELEEFDGEVTVPGLSSLPPTSMPDPMMKRNRCYTWFLYHGRRFREAKGIIVNTFAELEPGPLKAMAAGVCAVTRPTPPVYSVGPMLMLGQATTNGVQGPKPRHGCLSWLDEKPSESVVLLCFGSKGSFHVPQVKEVATALERSGHRFLWVLRMSPSGPDAEACSLDEALPEGFQERTRGRGLVWPSWAPQAEILAHEAVGGFVTHCGWNSTLESLWYGVPMLGWPLYAEQHMNAVLMARDAGVALELRVDRKAGNFVSAEELERGIRRLMEDSGEGEGRRVRTRAKEMKVASRKALMEEDGGGSSFVHVEKFARQLCM